MARLALALAAALVVAGCQQQPVDSSEPTAVTVEKLTLELPEGWQRTEPTSSMRKLQARIPGPGGDAEFAVFHFGEGQGGDVAANMQRWIDQIEFAPGADTHREEFSANGMTIYWVNFSGTLKPDPMTGQRERRPNSRMLGAVIEGPGGPWFLKAVGPDATLKGQRDAFLRMLESARPE
ncbi:MAG TPA: hypothetical protein VEB21_16935 [Terriglobales bacterium]|nr:hypothetical protein [Terriglobales bacterium]